MYGIYSVNRKENENSDFKKEGGKTSFKLERFITAPKKENAVKICKDNSNFIAICFCTGEVIAGELQSISTINDLERIEKLESENKILKQEYEHINEGLLDAENRYER